MEPIVFCAAQSYRETLPMLVLINPLPSICTCATNGSIYPAVPGFFYAGMHLPIYLYNLGVGFDLQSASDGVLQYHAASGPPVPGFQGSRRQSFFGEARLGFLQMGIDGNAIRTPGGDYENGTIEHNDPILNTGKYTGNGFQWEASLFFRAPLFQTSISVLDVPSHPIELD
ncbi:MAG: hypothetical protein IPP37_07230 [Saprospiraceae bacterium]|nr:hypothetical protein [Saprospiraceae bacterium]